MSGSTKYETVVGLEVHARLLTQSKLFSSDNAAYGDDPNTNVGYITLAHPGTLPKMNRKAIELAVKMGLACQSTITRYNYFARKNYFYPDLPKGYQVTQHSTPVCEGGEVTIEIEGTQKIIRLHHIHMEEDAGKSVHDMDPQKTGVDYNRAGTALIEIVSEPDIRTGEEAFAYLTEIRKLLRYLDICDGNMEEGSLRCDANISVRKMGETKLGTRVEIKNLNSMRNVKKAIEIESERLVGIIESNGTIIQETRAFDADRNITFATREKEDADDYRYFPEPDLTPFQLQGEFIEKIRAGIPVLAGTRIEKYMKELNLSAYDAEQLTEERTFSDYFESVVKHMHNYKAAANWMLQPVRTWMNTNGKGIEEFPISPEKLATVIGLVEAGKLSFSVASTKLLTALLNDPSAEPEQLAVSLNLVQQSDTGMIGPIIDEVLTKFADKVAEYKRGKKGLLALFVGEVMKRSKGKADPKITNELLLEKLKS